jgi:copper(I)-binding protein
VCERISLHETRTNDDGTVAMLYQERLDLVAGEPLVFRSGGLHLMCEGIVRQVNPGEVVPLYLETADGARQLLMVDVIRIADLVD